jgi:hypothetical protein
MDVSKLDNQKVKVAYKTYTIKLKDSIKQGQLLGEADHHKEIIKISRRQSPVAIVDTLVHEILHCIWYTNGIGYTLDGEEAEEFIVNSYATSIVTIFIDNPWIIKLIDEVI